MGDSKEFPPPAPPSKLQKKTRDLPNLSDCQGCKRRINSTNPKNRLQILASEWRIVLLCRGCYNLVEMSQNCSYCLVRVSCSSIESFVECKRCHRRIHKECVSMFSFGSVDNGENCSVDDFKVCFDCWLPKQLQNDYNARVIRSRSKRKEVKNGGEMVKGETMNSLGSSGVSDSQEKGKVLENAANDTQIVVKKKVSVALEAKAKALNKAMVAKRAVVLASSAVGSVSMEKDDDRRGSVVEDDAQLAFRLHRAMNSSPRISRNPCSLNTHCVDVPEVSGRNIDGLDLLTGLGASCATKRKKSADDERNGLSEAKLECEQKRAKNQDEKKHNEGSAGSLITYYRKGRASLKVEEEPDCSIRTDNGGLSSCNMRVKEESECVLMTYRRRLSKQKTCKREPGHCSKTYSRRHSAIPHCESKMINGINLENGTLTSEFALNR